MQAITKQLLRIRRTSRGLLVIQRLAQATAGVVLVLLILGLLDFGLRLPASLRIALMGALVLATATWLITRLLRAVRFAPTLTDLALRAERLFPQLTGKLASAVEFTEHADAYTKPERTAAMVQASRSRAQTQFEANQLRSLIAPRRTLASVLLALVVMLLMSAAVFAAPESSRIATARWLMPWQDTPWPKRTDVASLTASGAAAADQPLPLRAVVHKGHHEGMRVWAYYRLIDNDGEAGDWREALMSEQAAPSTSASASGNATDAHRFERLVELTDRAPAPNAIGQRGQVEYYFEAGDDRTERRRLDLVERPTVNTVRATLTPPAYARSLIEPHTTDLHGRSTQAPTARGLAGSTVKLHIGFNKPLRLTREQMRQIVPGLAQQSVNVTADGSSEASISYDDVQHTRGVTLTFPLERSVETTIELTDEHDFTNLSERRYAIEANVDEQPAVSMLAPDADRSVLPTARIDIEAVAQDDIGAESIRVEAEMPVEVDSGSEETTDVITIAQRSGQQQRLRVTQAFDLAEQTLAPGDVVTLTAIGRDVYEIDGQRHEPVRSSPRRLRIIDEATLTAQMRGELAGVRQAAIRLEAEQGQLSEQAPADAQSRQDRLTARLEAQRGLVQRLMDRAERNRLDAPSLDELMNQARNLLQQAEQASEEAQGNLEEAADDETSEAERQSLEQQSKAQQDAVRSNLSELVTLLDQGQDALALQIELRELRTTERNIEAETRELLPQTVGRDAEDLPEALRERLEDLAERQAEAAEQGDELVRDMQTTAQALSQPGQSDRSRAAGQSLAEAARVAQTEGLSEQMDESTESIEQNQLSRAGQAQTNSLDVMDRMLREMGKQDERMQEMLRRRMQQLAEVLERLIEQQQRQIASLEQAADQADALARLAPGQVQLRRLTMAAAEAARGAEQTAPIAATIDQAVTAQGEAIEALRDAQRDTARESEQAALEQLEQALAELKQQQEQMRQEETNDRRAELQAEYEKLANQQDALREQASELDEAEQLTRRQRAELINLGHQEEDLRIAAGELGEQIERAMLFQHLHGRIDESARETVTQLRRAVVSDEVLRHQQRVAADLRRMAAALERSQQDSEFAGQQGGGGSGGGQGQGQAPQLVPPMAELKLLRELQQSVKAQTESLDAREGGAAAARLIDLSAEQRSLADLGERLIQRVRQQQNQQQPNGGGR